jgi:hypothetical protein
MVIVMGLGRGPGPGLSALEQAPSVSALRGASSSEYFTNRTTILPYAPIARSNLNAMIRAHRPLHHSSGLNAQSRRFSAARKNCSALRANPSVTLVHTDSFRSGGNCLLTDAIASGTDLAVSSIIDHRL